MRLSGSDFEIVSCDSVQVYRYLDIGSGKPSKDDLNRVRHHLVDVVNPDEIFTAGSFVESACAAVERIEERGMVPLFAGGTGMYVDSFFYGISDIPEIDISIRKVLLQHLEEGAIGRLYDELYAVDPVFAASIHRNDRQRIVRGLEVYRGTGKPLSGFYSNKPKRVSEKTLFISIWRDRSELIERISARVDAMIAGGLVDEVDSIRKMGYSPNLKSMQSIGYKEINAYLNGNMNLDEAVDALKLETSRYAKRQMTWFRRNADAVWYNASDFEGIYSKIRYWLEGTQKKGCSNDKECQ